MKQRVSINWFVNGEPVERGVRVDYNANDWGAVTNKNWSRVRKIEIAADKACDKSDGVSVFLTSLDGQDTYGNFYWNEDKEAYDFHELG